MTKLRLSGVIRESIVDGPGIRLVVFAQGCPHKCKGCHNQGTLDPSGGYDTTVDNIIAAVKQNPLLQGVTLSGGDPFMQAEAFAVLAQEVHKLGLDVVTYTGYTVEQILSGMEACRGWKELLKNTDTLVDGPFILEQRNLMLKFRGSNNQRIIDPIATLELGRAIEKDF